MVLNPKTMGLGISLPINFIILVRPDNYTHQSLAMLISIAAGCIVFKVITINTPYCQGKIMQNAITRDLIQIMRKPLLGANSWFNARMADCLILLARHREVMQKYAVDRWYDVLYDLDLGDELFFIRRQTVKISELFIDQHEYFKQLTKLIEKNVMNSIGWISIGLINIL